jgi:hypothetical protein
VFIKALRKTLSKPQFAPPTGQFFVAKYAGEAEPFFRL